MEVHDEMRLSGIWTEGYLVGTSQDIQRSPVDNWRGRRPVYLGGYGEWLSRSEWHAGVWSTDLDSLVVPRGPTHRQHLIGSYADEVLHILRLDVAHS
ncbi:hypothetical protein KIPB_011877 [Kipferlia bialata]|uniref:Uncharacterized protein n=1 Tax=Kipferlia bialata TaxID=797122 RepID=A0A391P702_9EUKA|nr:hypothetical protein KIPB_011877 [Kipferlia bialata]|eukprot:g11877.t1